MKTFLICLLKRLNKLFVSSWFKYFWQKRTFPALELKINTIASSEELQYLNCLIIYGVIFEYSHKNLLSTRLLFFGITVKMTDLSSVISRVQLAPVAVNAIKKSKWPLSDSKIGYFYLAFINLINFSHQNCVILQQNWLYIKWKNIFHQQRP